MAGGLLAFLPPDLYPGRREGREEFRRQFTECDSNFDHFLFVWKREKVGKDLVFPKNNFYCVSLKENFELWRWHVNLFSLRSFICSRRLDLHLGPE